MYGIIGVIIIIMAIILLITDLKVMWLDYKMERWEEEIDKRIDDKIKDRVNYTIARALFDSKNFKEEMKKYKENKKE